MIRSVYIDPSEGRSHVIAQVVYDWHGISSAGRYYVTYNPNTSPCRGGIFVALEEAERQIEALRPTAKKLNGICINCKTKCEGTCEQVWTGCIERTV